MTHFHGNTVAEPSAAHRDPYSFTRPPPTQAVMRSVVVFFLSKNAQVWPN